MTWFRLLASQPPFESKIMETIYAIAIIGVRAVGSAIA